MLFLKGFESVAIQTMYPGTYVAYIVNSVGVQSIHFSLSSCWVVLRHRLGCFKCVYPSV